MANLYLNSVMSHKLHESNGIYYKMILGWLLYFCHCRMVAALFCQIGLVGGSTQVFDTGYSGSHIYLSGKWCTCSGILMTKYRKSCKKFIELPNLYCLA